MSAIIRISSMVSGLPVASRHLWISSFMYFIPFVFPDYIIQLFLVMTKKGMPSLKGGGGGIPHGLLQGHEKSLDLATQTN